MASGEVENLCCHALLSTDKIVFFVAVGIIKMSITIFNMRITGLTSRNWMIAHWTFFFLLVCYTLAAFFVNVFQCNPPIAEYDLIAVGKLQNPPRCANNNTFGIPLSIIHVAMDFCLLMVPIIVLWKIQMHWSTKIRLYFVFSIGAMSCIGSVMRQIAQGRLASDATCTCLRAPVTLHTGRLHYANRCIR